jgi:D-galactarolactone cycloisomerase
LGVPRRCGRHCHISAPGREIKTATKTLLIMNRRSFLATLAGAGAGALCLPALAADPNRDRLSAHKIAAVEIRKIRLTWPRLVGKNARLDIHGHGPTPDVCLLKTDQGAMGWGMIRGSAQTVRDLQSEVMGKPVSDLISTTGITAPILRCFDLPLHDLAGVILGQPVWKMLGRAEPFITKIYSGMIYFDDLEPADKPAGIDKILEECRADYNYGYRQFKAKIGRGHKWMPAVAGLQRDIDVVRAIGQAFPDCEVLVDANNGYTVDTAIAFLKGLKGMPLFWFEEPFHETLADWRKLHAWMRDNGYAKTYRADGEANPDTAVLDQLGEEGVVNLRLEDIMSYGFTEWRKLMPELARNNITASPHTWGAGLKTVYTAHLAGGLGNTPTLEGVTCSQEDVSYGGNRIVKGNFQPSREPGFGLTLAKS